MGKERTNRCIDEKYISLVTYTWSLSNTGSVADDVGHHVLLREGTWSIHNLSHNVIQSLSNPVRNSLLVMKRKSRQNMLPEAGHGNIEHLVQLHTAPPGKNM